MFEKTISYVEARPVHGLKGGDEDREEPYEAKGSFFGLILLVADVEMDRLRPGGF